LRTGEKNTLLQKPKRETVRVLRTGEKGKGRVSRRAGNRRKESYLGVGEKKKEERIIGGGGGATLPTPASARIGSIRSSATCNRNRGRGRKNCLEKKEIFEKRTEKGYLEEARGALMIKEKRGARREGTCTTRQKEKHIAGCLAKTTLQRSRTGRVMERAI